MAAKTDLPKELHALVEDIGRPVTSDDIDVYRELQRIKDATYQLRTVLRAWKEQQTQDRELRSRYATWLVIAMGVQQCRIGFVGQPSAAGLWEGAVQFPYRPAHTALRDSTEFGRIIL